MNAGETKKKLIELIAKHQIENSGKKLKISDLSEQANISRQTFNRYYNDLKPYLSGKAIQGVLNNIDSSATTDLLSQSRTRIAELESKIAQMELKHTQEIKEIDETYITSLMNDDIALFDASEIRQNMIKHSLHIEKLLAKINELENELTKQQINHLSMMNLEKINPSIRKNISIIEPNLNRLFESYSHNKDESIFEEEKDKEIFSLVEKINKLLSHKECKLVIFIDRYFSSFEKFTGDFVCKGSMTHILLRLPLFSQIERRMFLNGLIKNGDITIYFPFCNSDTVLRAQRTFLFRNIPSREAESADKAQPPIVKDGYNEIIMNCVRQGD